MENKLLTGFAIVIICYCTIFGFLFYKHWQRGIEFRGLLKDRGLEIKEIHMSSIYVIVDKTEFLELAEKTGIVYKQMERYFVYVDGLWYGYKVPTFKGD